MYSEGTVIGGRYRLVRKVGEGGMAAVWEAEHLTLGSPVAVKFLQSAAGTRSDETTSERFIREARVAAKVRHRNVIEITDFGVTDDGAPYMVLELLQGQSLADRMGEGLPMDVAESCRIVSLSLRGLAAVHDAGIVHRDLKPENIFLVRDADGIFPKLLDFGVSRQTDSWKSKSLTQEGFLLGTPDYMSPEQARGVRDIDLRTDIYSMGVILYECVTGRLPFESENVGDLIVMITTQDPPPVRSLRPECPETVAAVIERAMRRDRDKRFQEAREMRRALVGAMGETEGFTERGSGLVSISEQPPAASGSAGTNGHTVQAGASRGARSDKTTDAAPDEASARTAGAAATGALGAPPPPRTAVAGPQRTRGTRAFGLVALVLAGTALGGGALYHFRPGLFAASPEPATAQPSAWSPKTAGLPSSVLDAGIPDAGRRVKVHLRSLPDAATVHVDGVPITGSVAELPAGGWRYTLEVRSADGEVLWRTAHPGTVDGEYQVWRMAADQLDAGARDGATTPPDAGTAEGRDERLAP